MAVTIKMIQEKQFTIKARGYDTDEVDDLLEDIMDEMEAHEREIKDLRARLAQATASADKPAEQPVQPVIRDDSEGARALLANAQRVYDQTVADAQNRAAEILAKAQEDADKVAANVRKETQELNDQLDTLRGAAADYRARFQRLVDDQMHVLKAETELFKSK